MMTKDTAVQRKNRDFSAKSLMPIIVFFQYFEEEFHACNIHDNAAVLLVRHYVAGSIEEVIKAPVDLRKKSPESKESC